MSDLNTKVKDCENKKLSLVTAIKIFKQAINTQWQTQKDKRKSKQATGNICLDRREIETRNTNYTRNTDTRNTNTRNTGTRNTDTRNTGTRNTVPILEIPIL